MSGIECFSHTKTKRKPLKSTNLHKRTSFRECKKEEVRNNCSSSGSSKIGWSCTATNIYMSLCAILKKSHKRWNIEAAATTVTAAAALADKSENLFSADTVSVWRRYGYGDIETTRNHLAVEPAIETGHSILSNDECCAHVQSSKNAPRV